MAKSRASETPLTGKKRKLENPDSVTPKRLRQDGTPKPKTPAAKTPRTRPTPTPASATPNATFMTAREDVTDDEDDTLQPQTPAAASPLEQLRSTKAQRIAHRPSPVIAESNAVDNVLAGSDGQDEKQKAQRVAKKARRRSEKGSKDEPKKKAQESEDVMAIDDIAMEIVVDQSRLPWNLQSNHAGLYLDQDPIFLANNNGDEFLVAAQGDEVQLLSLETSLIERIRKAAPGLKIRSIAASSDGNSIIIAYTNGAAAEWNPFNGEFSSRTRFCKAKKHKPVALAVSSSAEPDVKDDNFLIVDKKGLPASYIHLNREIIYTTKKPLTFISVVGSGEFVVATGHDVLVLGRRRGNTASDDQGSYVWVTVPTTQPFTCFDARLLQAQGTSKRFGLALALGHTNGQIHLYDDISTIFHQSQPQLQSPRILHWHRESVCAVKFSRDGNYLVSGGKETVLTIWQLATGNKQFLPHLTSTIEGIVVNGKGDRYALRMGDNSIMVLSTSELKPVANFAGLQMFASSKSSDELDPTPQAAAIHPDNPNHLLLTVPATRPKGDEIVPARPFLQTFDMRDSRHVARQALTRNNVTDQNTGPRNQPIVSPDVIQLSISADGQWLATVDEWMPSILDMGTLAPGDSAKVEEERLKRREVYLKFWKWDESEGIWTLATRADAPHARHSRDAAGAGEVFGIASDPNTTGFATIGEDGCVRIWRPKNRVRDGVNMQAQDGNEIVEWACRRTIDLPRDVERADSPMDEDNEPEAPTHACLAFSSDGSMLAAAQALENENDAPLIHFINVSSGDRITKSTVAPSDVVNLAFVDRYLVTLGRRTAHVWDIVEDKLNSRLAFAHDDLPRLAVEEASGTFAVANHGQVSLFKAGQSEPLQEVKLEVPIAAILSSRRGYTLLFDDCTIRQLTPSANIERQALAGAVAGAELVEDEEVNQDDAPDLFGGATKAVAASEDVDMADVEDDRPVVRPEQLAQIFDSGSSHVMQPVQDMFEAVVGLFARKPYVRMGGTSES